MRNRTTARLVIAAALFAAIGIVVVALRRGAEPPTAPATGAPDSGAEGTGPVPRTRPAVGTAVPPQAPTPATPAADAALSGEVRDAAGRPAQKAVGSTERTNMLLRVTGTALGVVPFRARATLKYAGTQTM